MSDRKLAHIEVIESLSPIKGADNIEMAQVLGWECVVKKGEFKVGDIIIYIEVDSIMPDRPEFEFLRERKFRIKTIKLREQISQGLVLPLGSLSGFIGDDVTEILGVTKYLSPSEREEIVKELKGNHWINKNRFTKYLMKYKWFRQLVFPTKSKGWPNWVSKTDEERIQNMPRILEKSKNSKVYITEKIDYQSATFTGKLMPKYKWLGKYSPMKYKLIVCSRNHVTNDKNSLYWRIATKYNIEKILTENPTLTIQGEQGNTNVQKNKYGIKEPTMWVFNIIDHEKDYHYNYTEMADFCNKYNLPIVPIITHTFKLPNSNSEVSTIFPFLSDLGSTVHELVEFSKGKSVINPKIEREGVVVRCIENGKKFFSFKVINPNFLIKNDE